MVAGTAIVETDRRCLTRTCGYSVKSELSQQFNSYYNDFRIPTVQVTITYAIVACTKKNSNRKMTNGSEFAAIPPTANKTVMITVGTISIRNHLMYLCAGVYVPITHPASVK